MGCIAEGWSRKFGLASVPLFQVPRIGDDDHHVLLNGALGSFAISESTDRIWRDPKASTWAWSCGVPHHVTVTPAEVAVVRWDRPIPEEFSRESVEAGLGAFYAFMVADRVRSTRRVVDHFVEVFRRTRSLLRDEGLPDAKSVQAYLGVLATGMSRVSEEKRVPIPNPELMEALPPIAVEVLVDQIIRDGAGMRADLTVRPDLAIRHAGSEIFQEAHFALVSGGARDMFDWIAPAVASRSTRGSSHFTPPALARSLTEQVLRELGDLSKLRTLSLLDPACGSGSFLYEAIRTLRRAGFDGKLELFGRDISTAAVDMARFTLAFAARDWRPAGGLDVDLAVADALEGNLPQVDAVLMNPPFLSWSAMDASERDRMKRILGSSAKGRIDLSMAFVSKGLAALREGGVVGAVMPTSILASNAAEPWRKSVLELGDLRTVASLGEYGLFTHALVTVATVVVRRHQAGPRGSEETLAVVAGKTAEATGDALRAIRREAATRSAVRSEEDWEIFRVPGDYFRKAPSWRPIRPSVATAIERLSGLGVTRPIGELFHVFQGVRTGWIKGFVLTEAQLGALGPRERKWFRPASMGDNIVAGRLQDTEWVFYPYGENGPALQSEKISVVSCRDITSAGWNRTGTFSLTARRTPTVPDWIGGASHDLEVGDRPRYRVLCPNILGGPAALPWTLKGATWSFRDLPGS